MRQTMTWKRMLGRGDHLPDPFNDAVLHRLLQKVWEISSHETSRFCASKTARVYRRHYQDEVSWSGLPHQTQQGVRLVSVVKGHARSSLQDISDALRTELSAQRQTQLSDDEVYGVLIAAAKLWLFVAISVTDKSLTLAEAVKAAVPAPTRVSSRLSNDFSQKSLARKAGISFNYTSEIGDHLSISSSGEVLLFRHARILAHLDSGDFADLFPPGFLEEVERTFRLLFPTHGGKTSRRTRKLERRKEVELDVEVGPKDFLIRELSSYRYFGARLAALQEQYDESKPRKLKQWWFDRRKRVEWATFILAVIVFTLTVIFGVISSVTGIIQVYASFEALRIG